MKKLAVIAMALGLVFGGAACSKSGLVKVEGKRISIQKAIHFETNSDKISSGTDILDAVAEVMQSNTLKTARVRVEGNTDNTGDESINLDLSARRATAVKNYLVSKGIDAGRIDTKGNGSANPVEKNDTTEGREKNRRVDFVVLD